MSKRNDMTYEEFRQRFEYDSRKRPIGQGAHCDVFKAYDRQLHRYVAIKVSKVDITGKTISLKEETERVLKLPQNDNIAYYEKCYRYPTGEFEFDYAILEYYEKGNLLKFNQQTPSLTIEQKLSILKEILDGIHFLHTNNITHRDLKPENILIFHDEIKGKYIPKITDFEASKDVSSDKPSEKIATPFYAAPEQLKEGYHTDYNTDLWSFGITALVFLGALSSSDTKAVEQIKQGILPPVDFLPEAWQKLIKECLIENTKDRIQSCDDCLKIIADYESSKDSGEEMRTQRRSKIRKWIHSFGPFPNRKIQTKYFFIFVFTVLLLVVGSLIAYIIDKVDNSSFTPIIKIVDWNNETSNQEIYDKDGIIHFDIEGQGPQELTKTNQGKFKLESLPASFNQSVRVYYQPQPQFKFMELDTTITIQKSNHIHYLKMYFKGIDKITRTVQDKDGKNIEGAIAYIKEIEGITDKDGKFTITLPPEKQERFQRLIITKEGYGDYDKKLDMTLSDSIIFLDIKKK